MLNFLRFSLCAVVLATSYPVAAVDLEKGKEINGTCAACHSDNGQGASGVNTRGLLVSRSNTSKVS